jgi:NADH-quinone oxidoreductase subunit G
VALDTLGQVRERMAELAPALGRIGEVEPAAWGPFGSEGELDAAAFRSPVESFFATDPIARASATMAACAEAVRDPEGAVLRTGTHG